MMVIASFGEGENSDNYLNNRTISIEILKKGTLAVEVHLSVIDVPFSSATAWDSHLEVRILRK